MIPKCSLLSYAPNPQSVINRYLNRNKQKREIFNRNFIRIKLNSLINKGIVNKNQRLFVEKNSSKLATPVNKPRRAGVFDMQTFLNTGPMKQSKSILLESQHELDQNSEISQEFETETNVKVIVVNFYDFYKN